MTIPIRISEEGLEVYAQPVEKALGRLYYRGVLLRDNGKCVLCGKTATEVDHIFTKKEARCNRKILKIRNKEQFLRSLCTPCHRRRHGRKWSWSSIMQMIEEHPPAPG